MDMLCGRFPEIEDEAGRKYDDDPTKANLDAEPLAVLRTEVNRLKYVCPQLNTKTRVIAISINDIAFLQGVQDVNQLRESMPKSYPEPYIDDTIHKESDNEDDTICGSSSQDALIAFSKQESSTTIKLRHLWLNPWGHESFDRAVGSAVHFRESRDFITRVTANPQEQQYLANESLRIWAKTSDAERFGNIQENL
jgi:hypothetical protein